MNSKKGELLSLFPTPVVKTNIGRNFTEDETDCIANIPMIKNQVATNHQSKDLYLFDNEFAERLKDIKKFCEQELELYLEKIEGVDTNLATLRITQSWLNKNKPDEWHPIHNHPNSYLSGVLYINCLPNDSILFTNRSLGLYNNIEFQKNKVTMWNASAYEQNITEGDLILFPSWIPHSVNQNETKVDRLSLSFNTFPIGEMGEYYGSHLKL